MVGENTPGAAHRTMTYQMNDIFLLHWPYERSHHAKDGSDIEGRGITPDHFSHYNQAKYVAIQLAKSQQTELSGSIAASHKTNLLKALEKTLNAQSNDELEKFVAKYVEQKSEVEVMSTLNKYSIVWSDHFKQKIINIHQLTGNGLRVFIQNAHGILQMKLQLNQSNKIEQLKYRL